jgi:ribulose-phosphate 3-epimerase
MIIPGIFEKDFEEVKRKIALIDSIAKLIQIDIADGEMVDGSTFLEITKLNEIQTKAKFDIDLMVENPMKYLNIKIKDAVKISMLTDAELYIEPFIKKAKSLGYQVGLSLRPGTKVETIEKYIKDLDYLQFFTINPGGSGREFQIEVLDKLDEFRRKYPTFPIQVDGGIDADYLPLVLRVGVNDAVMTSHLFGAEDPKGAFMTYMGISKKY